jgi:hypothetical protein
MDRWSGIRNLGSFATGNEQMNRDRTILRSQLTGDVQNSSAPPYYARKKRTLYSYVEARLVRVSVPEALAESSVVPSVGFPVREVELHRLLSRTATRLPSAKH